MTVLACVQWPPPGQEVAPPPPPLPGFVISSFGPLVAHIAGQCLHQRHGAAPPVKGTVAGRTGVVMVSARGDMATAYAVARAVDRGDRVSPLLFFQTALTAVVGRVAVRWGLAGPVVCISPEDHPLGDGLAEAASLIADGDADEVLVVLPEQGASPGDGDAALALIVSGRTVSDCTVSDCTVSDCTVSDSTVPAGQEGIS
jgi:hypothetical protein